MSGIENLGTGSIPKLNKERSVPKRAKELAPLEVKRLTKPGVHAVGGVAGLALQVTSTGARSWVFRYRHNGRRREAGLGPYPDVPLAKARDYAREARELLRNGVDPIAERQAARRKLLTFAEAVERYAEEKTVEFNSHLHRKQWKASLKRHAIPTLGAIAVTDVSLQDVLETLRPIWTEKTETASKVRQRIERVLDYATVAGYRSGENPARWRGNLDMVLPAPTKLTGAKNYPALRLDDASRWFRALQARSGTSARALEFQALTAARTGAVRFATWDEMDLEKGLWTIQPGRQSSKIPPSGKPHRVPLSAQALRILSELPRETNNPLVFLAPRGGPMSDASLAAVMRKIHAADMREGEGGYLDAQHGRPAVPHGLRSTFRTWVAECTQFDGDMAEIALAHKVGTKVQQAYDRSDQLVKRKGMMEAWALFLQGDHQSKSNNQFGRG
ncbi:integrase arm-type DNA-binding domain-containing protein [Aliiroseovarius sp. F20344]|uniref:tyrosine-type recombinase/integrase n=1 Tax=Aliiroseovarius sp. F20344 TaxID=2926414 RepID=UPI001FF1C85C|nr:integrase arm-type DNA-binding domain-containing protein [Aliiroseovarius sp. F20344]MCK0142992.1 integrase arm-type DNA-binding domain-containing protein [Aliiroseovarius sp. F20344]